MVCDAGFHCSIGSDNGRVRNYAICDSEARSGPCSDEGQVDAVDYELAQRVRH